MSMAYIRKTYSVPAQRGGRIRYEGQLSGVIVGSSGAHLRVRFPMLGKTAILHPTWRVEYLPNNPKGTEVKHE